MSSASPVREAALQMERIDTHGHLADEYPALDEQAAEWAHFASTQGMVDSRAAAEGCRALYGIDPGPHLRPDGADAIFRKAAEYRARGAWEAIHSALDQARIRTQIIFCELTAESRPFTGVDSADRLAYLGFIDSALSGDGQYPCPDFVQAEPDFCYHERLCRQFGPLNRLDDYLDALDAGIDRWRSLSVVGLKTAMAYTTGLAVSDPSLADVRTAFARKNDMTAQDFRVVHDYAFRHALQACRRNQLPVVIHTGFQIWGHASLAQSNPMLLHNLLIDPRYREITFVLLHGGNPYVGETTYLAGMFPNVILDFTWMGWMTPDRFSRALAEWLAAVPHDRICWGSDSHSPESIAGVDRIMRRLIADALEASMAQGIIGEKYAMEFIANSYLDTPQRVFDL